VRPELPCGTVTFLFTDVEASTKLLHELGAKDYADALAEHRRLIREACAEQGGVEVDTQGDAFFFAFPTAPGALDAASSLTDALAAGSIQVRVGLHTGTPLLSEEGYVGDDVHRAARIAACGHGGQVLVSSATERLVDVELRDLGDHRFKDLTAPERVFQLGSGDFPPLKTLHQTNLPVPQTPFLGREKELGEVLSLLGREDVRLVTLTGPGGTGKTRLATQAAGALAESYPHGVWWVPLAPFRAPELVLEAAAQVLGAKDDLTAHIEAKEMLLLFDNFEQVVEAAGGLSDLLGSCPKLELLVTSREPLRLSGEHEYPVPPLVHEEGVGFFLARARAIQPDFEANGPVSEICSRLDDLPLALELAASRVKALSPEQILDRLEQRLPLLTGGARDAPERQRTLRATIEWSYELLSAEERALFARLSVFAGGCTLDAAEEVCEADLDTLQSLVEKSLLRFSDERYWMLETIREYAGELLDEAGEADELRQRHRNRFLALAERTAPELGRYPTTARLEALGSLAAESDNLHTALDWALAGSADNAVELLAGVLAWHWLEQGHVTVGARLLETALEHCTTVQSEAELHARLSGARFAAGESDTAYLEAHQGYELVAGREPSAGKVLVILRLAGLHSLLVDRNPAQAIPLGEEALAVAEEVGDLNARIRARVGLGQALSWSGDPDRGLGLLRESFDLALSTDDGVTVATAYESMFDSIYLHPVARRTEAARITEQMLMRYPLEDRVREYAAGWLPWVFLQSGDWNRADELINLQQDTHLEGFVRIAHFVERATLRWMQGRLEDAEVDLAELEELIINPRWFHDYFPLVADVATDTGRLADVRIAADEYLSVDVDPSEEAKKVGVLCPLVRAEVDAALAASAKERPEHVERAQAAAARARAILEEFPPPGAGSVQMETPTTYLAIIEGELSRATRPNPALWRDAVDRADFVYFRLYARWRLAESLVEVGQREQAEAELASVHAEATRIGADGLRANLEALAARTSLDLRGQRTGFREQ
jgi:predicted ATPase